MSLLSARRVWRITHRAWRQAPSQAPLPTYTSDHVPRNGVPCAAAAPRRSGSLTGGSGRAGVISTPWLTRRAGRQGLP